MKRLGLVMGLCLLVVTSIHAREFVDVASGHWAKQSIDKVVDLGILAGYEDDTFRGENRVNRYEVSIFLDNLLRAIDRRYASKQVQDAFIAEYEYSAEERDAQDKQYYRVAKVEWHNLLKDLEYLRAEVSELRKQVANQHASR